MCHGEIGIFRGFIIRDGQKIPLIEVNKEIVELSIPIPEDIKVGDKIMVYNAYHFDYEFKTLNLNISLKGLKNIIRSLFSPRLSYL
ncbi:hypothetical protein [Methanocaldococcus infernus]|uniref:Uncharacterized protein n=1 Tax=Methanocaldococcus infernus (strain DSM 11812 / JCM 15783 / ME) TaxID=573063 RepID=D5VU95_METIM|nr:hypothetical protein [Methanocaldococcus infernus]ADG12707.1 conserved hypothetical protein [Methanocaldococcus infernus ME]